MAAAAALAETRRTRHPSDGFLLHPALEITATGPDSVHVRTNDPEGGSRLHAWVGRSVPTPLHRQYVTSVYVTLHMRM